MPTKKPGMKLKPLASTTSATASPAHASATLASTSGPPTQVVFIPAPPSNATIPPVPAGFDPTSGSNYRGVQPRKSELVALPLAIRDLRSFTNYGAILGTVAPPLAELEQSFDVSNAWSSMRNESSAWDAYCRDQEGVAWRAMRALMSRLKPLFVLAAKANPSLATTYAGLAALLGAKTVSANKAVATKKKNKAAGVAGKPASHGAVGKARQKAAAKAALAAQNGKNASAPVGTSATQENAQPIDATSAQPATPAGGATAVTAAPVAGAKS